MQKIVKIRFANSGKTLLFVQNALSFQYEVIKLIGEFNDVYKKRNLPEYKIFSELLELFSVLKISANFIYAQK
jgi:hypothetical protein